VIWDFIGFLLWLFLLFLIGRLIFDWVQVFARDWRPRGVLLVVAEAIYTVTDPPLRFLRRLIPQYEPNFKHVVFLAQAKALVSRLYDLRHGCQPQQPT